MEKFLDRHKLPKQAHEEIKKSEYSYYRDCITNLKI